MNGEVLSPEILEAIGFRDKLGEGILNMIVDNEHVINASTIKAELGVGIGGREVQAVLAKLLNAALIIEAGRTWYFEMTGKGWDTYQYLSGN